jgi:copper chaperone
LSKASVVLVCIASRTHINEPLANLLIQGEQIMTTVSYTVPAIHCGHCTHTIEMEVGELQGVQSVKADQTSKKVQITFDAPATEEKIKSLLAEIDYPVEGLISL